MERGSRIGWTIVLTVAFAANVGVMFSVAKRFDAVWFSASAAGFFVLLLLVWLLGRGKGESRVAGELAAGDAPSGSKHSPTSWTMPVRPDGGSPTGLPTIEVAAKETPVLDVPVAAVAPFSTKGFTLFERTAKGKTSYVFSKSKVIGGRAIPLPEGAVVGWDKKAKKPTLELPLASTTSAVAHEADDSLTVGVATPVQAQFDARRCAAMPTPGDFCNNLAKGADKYCAKHANFESMKTTLVVRADGREGKAVKGIKFGLPDFLVRTPKGTAAKGAGLKTVRTTLDVRTAKPKAGKALRVGAAELEVETPRGNTPAKAWRVASPKLDVHFAKSQGPRTMRVAEPRLDIHAPHASEPSTMRVREPTLNVRSTTAAAPTTMRVREPNLNIRAPRTAVARPMRLKEPNVDIREPKTAKSKPLKVKDAELKVRQAKGGDPRPLRVQEPTLAFRKAPKNMSPPLKIRETYLDVRAPRSHGVRPMKLVEPEMNVRTSRPKGNTKPLRVAEPKLDLHPAEAHNPHAMRVDEPQVVVRPKKQLSQGKPLKVVETTLNVVRPKAKNLGALKDFVVPKDPDVVADTKKRSSFGLPAADGKKRRR